MASVLDTLDIIKTALVKWCFLSVDNGANALYVGKKRERAPDWVRTQQGPPTPRLYSDTFLMTELGVFVIFGMEKEPSQNKRVRGCAGFA